jgi:hypothetical protein
MLTGGAGGLSGKERKLLHFEGQCLDIPFKPVTIKTVVHAPY